MTKKTLSKLLPFLFILTLNSCIGLSTDIQMRKDGSGRITMEYHVSSMAENIGRLDGNERWPVIPVGRSDWERSVQRVDAVKLVSFSSRQEANEVITKVTLDYENTDALARLLDPSGNKVSFSQGKFDIILLEPVSAELDPGLLELMKQVSASNKFTISFTAESNAVLTVIDGTKKEIQPPAGCVLSSSGKKVSFSIDIAGLFYQKDGLGISVIW